MALETQKSSHYRVNMTMLTLQVLSIRHIISITENEDLLQEYDTEDTLNEHILQSPFQHACPLLHHSVAVAMSMLCS